MGFYKKYFPIVFLLILLIVLVLMPDKNISTSTMLSRNQVETILADPTERLKRLEPEKPQDLNDPPFYQLPLPSQVKPIKQVIEVGQEVPLKFAYNNPNWQRPAYKTYWSSSVSGGRWSYVPNRIHFALHRIFATYPTASVYYDFIHDLGIVEESQVFEYNVSKPFENIVIVVMQGDVKRIFTSSNQVVLEAEPKRNGLQVVTIPASSIQPANQQDAILVQLATPDGYELDYSLISYIKAW